MISGASEEELILAEARVDVMLALDDAHHNKSWLIIDNYIEKLEEENQKLTHIMEEVKDFLEEIEKYIKGRCPMDEYNSIMDEIEQLQEEE